GARAPGSVRPQPKSWSTYGAPPLPHEMGCHHHRSCRRRAHARARRSRHRSRPPFRQKPATKLPLTVTMPSTPTKKTKASLPPAIPTTTRPLSPRSEPFITTATASSFQIRRGRKPTLITEATRGESSSPVINKFNSIPLRSSKPFIMQATVHPLPITSCIQHAPAAPTRTLPRSDATTSAPPANRLHRPQSRRPLAPAFTNPDPMQRTHVVNVGSAVDDRRFALKAAAKATELAATVSSEFFL
ncbi:hypothetical protein ACLOJK_004254, partial [Asimina triloba]